MKYPETTLLKARRMYASGDSLSEVSAATGVPISTVRRHLLAVNELRTRQAAGEIIREQGRRIGQGLGRKRAPFTPETIQKMSAAKKGKGRGWRINSNGYIEFTMGEHAGRNEHVVKMEQAIGRPLRAGECVHHINQCKTDNRLENLQLMTVSEHIKLHRRLDSDQRQRNSRGQYA